MGNQDQNSVIVSSSNKQSSLFYIYSYPVVFSPILLFSSEETGIAHNIIVSDDFTKLFVVSESDGLIIYDIQDIKNPVKKENLNFGDNHIYAAYYNSKSMAAIIEINTGIEIVSISSTYNYIFLGEVTYNNFQPVSVAFSQNGDYLFVLDELLNQVLIFDISNLPSYSLVKSINLEYSPYQIEVRDKYAYLAAGYQGVIILDIQNVNNAQIIGQVQLPTLATFVTYIEEDDLLIASDLEYGLQIIQWDDIQYPVIINQADTLDKCYQVVQEKNSQDFYVASGTAGIQGFRLKFSQTEQVIETLTENIPYHRIIKEINIQNLSYTYITQNAQYLFAVSTDGEFYSYNNSDKTSPVLSKQIAIGGIPKEIIVSISKNYAYVTLD
ncbi:Quinoprotein amine dehydrogenase, beta chain-like protein [Pseudocohnilembus persalinus]|uniref:Quinoprotein amine dehydrogenase, beta chain-like protein n=1 Tax=Pseudocohnilembus persalinus TaxID=266149 RepID=A0A0V0QK87_PSEPJ|nr:Quinoprotein amine dehydrogenase, beta chain-like protein [Pseudocohnilembus persalinus]|eukprot:KRX02615.1 Quinoprotein amine dehydrogenase, beta chain-like protein [Pseudocohnilembus persalinus]